MLVLHCAFNDGRLMLWGEARAEDAGVSRPPRPARTETRRKRGSGATRQQRVDPCPFAATAGEIEAALATVGVRASDAARTSIAWLPTVAGSPIASTPLIAEPPADTSGAVLAPWLVPTLRLTVDEMLEFLPLCAGARMLGPGVLVGADLAFWAEALRYGASLVAREQFLPSLEPPGPAREAPAKPLRRGAAGRARRNGRAAASEDECWRAPWVPVIAADAARRLQVLIERMPDACRALADREATEAPATPGRPPAVEADSLLRRFVGDVVDAMVRAGIRERPAPPPRGIPRGATSSFDSLHEQWLAALRSADGVMVGRREDLARLAGQVREWHRPVALAEAAPFRLAFRLVEPEDDSGEDGAWRVEYLLQPVRDPSLLVTAADVWAGGRRTALLGGDLDARSYLLRALGQAASIADAVETSLRSPEPAGFETGTDGAFRFLTETAWALEEAGYAVMLPAWWTRKGARARLGLRAHVRDSMNAPTGLSLDTLLAVDWEAALGDQAVSVAEIERLARFKAPLVRVRGQWVQVTAEDRQRAIEFLERRRAGRIGVGELLRMALGAVTEAPGGLPIAGVQADGWFRDILARLEQHAPLEELEAPAGFNGALRPYQARGYSWLAFMRAWAVGACLADDMGLGKTVQALALMLRDWMLGERRPVLLVCPTSVVGNWQKEAARFTPALPTLVHHGASRAKDAAFAARAGAHGLVISSYALLHRDIERFKGVRWRGVILDEAQNIKNPETKQARAARALEAEYRVALTGTPVENNVGDLWSIMEFLNPGFLGPLQAFRRRFLLPIQMGTDPEAAERLKRLTGPFVLRRMKTDRSIIADLPEKQEMKVYCTLTREQASLYGAVVKDAERALRASEGIARKGVVLATLSKLKQVCNHPAQFLGEGGPLAGRSGKLARLSEMLEEVAGTGERALVFSQFAEMGELLKRHLESTFGREVLFLHGGVSKEQRDLMVERFQSREGDAFVFVLSLKAGGTGLNLTAASHVFLFDRWWNPAVENQAIDRAFRIGQTRDVQVHKFLCAGTLEERIDEMLERKLTIASRVVGTGEAWLTELSTAELREVFALREGAVAE